MSSIQDQIAAAWKKYSESSSVMKNRENFEAGYLAGLRSLFVEVKPEDVRIRDSVECWARINNKWYQGTYWKAADEIDFSPSSGLAFGSYSRTRFDSVVRVLNLPSPSDLFTEGGA